MLALLLFMSVLSAGSCKADYGIKQCGPTPNDFENDFVRYCEERLDSNTCSTAWTEFLGTFARKNPGNVKPGDYNGYFNAVGLSIPRNKALFWSRTRELAELLPMMTMFIVSSNDVIVAQILNSFDIDTCWCWDNENDKLDTTNSCPTSPSVDFWVQFSVRFAEASEGIVFFLANGHSPPVYRQNSLFKCYEIPSFKSDKVTRLVALNIHMESTGESCGQDSLKNLCEDTLKRRIPYSCYDIYGTISDAVNMGATWKHLTKTISDIQLGINNTVTTKCSAVVSSAAISLIVLHIVLLMLL